MSFFIRSVREGSDFTFPTSLNPRWIRVVPVQHLQVPLLVEPKHHLKQCTLLLRSCHPESKHAEKIYKFYHSSAAIGCALCVCACMCAYISCVHYTLSFPLPRQYCAICNIFSDIPFATFRIGLSPSSNVSTVW